MQGVDAVLNQAVASFNQRCAVAGGRPDGQADYCAAQPCESCHGADGCGWCSGRNVCSNECVSIKGQCGAPLPLLPTSRLDSCASKSLCTACANLRERGLAEGVVSLGAETAERGKVDTCATVVDCASCNKRPTCGWCTDGQRHVCSGSCDHSSTVDQCEATNEHIHDGTGNHGLAPPPPAGGGH